MSMNKPNRKWGAALFTFLVGMLAMAGVGYAVKATDQATFCASCHAMSEAAWTHQNSIHAKLDCNECHTPFSIPEKMPFKTAVGINDIYTNTFTSIKDNIHASDDMKAVIQANCRRCHTATTVKVDMAVKQYCTDCHRTVPHNSKLPIDRRKAADA